MKLRYLAGLLAAVTVLLGTAALAVPSANAAQGENLGSLVLTPSAGTDLTGIHVTTSGPCPAKADAFFVKIYGKGMPKDGQVVTENTSAGLSRTAPFDAYFLQIMRDYGTDNHATIGGDYTVKLSCIDSFTTADYGIYTGTFTFTTPKKYKATGVSANAPNAGANAAPNGAASTATPTPAASGAATSGALPTVTASAGPAQTAAAQPTSSVDAGAAGSGDSGSSTSSVLWAIALVAVIGLVCAWVLRAWTTRARR